MVLEKVTLENTTLSVSKKGINCQELICILKNAKIPCKVSKNYTISNTGFPENGCEIFLPSIIKSNLVNHVWKPIQIHYGFQCAHIMIPNRFNGCIHDFIRLRGCDDCTKK